jgi:hypothetical protein
MKNFVVVQPRIIFCSCLNFVNVKIVAIPYDTPKKYDAVASRESASGISAIV